jgi:hypothetical protein
MYVKSEIKFYVMKQQILVSVVHSMDVRTRDNIQLAMAVCISQYHRLNLAMCISDTITDWAVCISQDDVLNLALCIRQYHRLIWLYASFNDAITDWAVCSQFHRLSWLYASMTPSQTAVCIRQYHRLSWLYASMTPSQIGLCGSDSITDLFGCTHQWHHTDWAVCSQYQT